MAYGDKYSFGEPEADMQVYRDGTELPHLEVPVYRNGVMIGYAEIHLHRTKYSPHVSLGLTSRLRSD